MPSKATTASGRILTGSMQQSQQWYTVDKQHFKADMLAGFLARYDCNDSAVSGPAAHLQGAGRKRHCRSHTARARCAVFHQPRPCHDFCWRDPHVLQTCTLSQVTPHFPPCTLPLILYELEKLTQTTPFLAPLGLCFGEIKGTFSRLC